MYGLVNQAIESLVKERFGHHTWQAICQLAEVEAPTFVAMQSYPDPLTYRLVGAASEVLGLSPEAVLEAFGEYWVLYTAEQGYGDMLAMAGSTLPVFLQNLDLLHNIVGNAMPNLLPPMFSCSDISAQSLVLHYHSKRAGLAPMVVGLLKGLGKRFGLQCRVEQLTHKTADSGHDSFLVKW
jgi:hypothetical protein